MKINNKTILSSILATGVLISLFTTNAITANALDETNNDIDKTAQKENEEGIKVVETPTTITLQNDISIQATTDSAFPESSKNLNDALVNKYGTTIDSNNDKIISIEEANAYTGEILVTGAIGGTIDGIQHFTKVTKLNFPGNGFTGDIPQSIGEMKNLTSMAMRGNNLSGSIPDSIGELSKLTSLDLMDNNLSGNIPSSIGNLSNLIYLYLSNNNLSGEIPESLGNLSDLIHIYFADNNLNGIIPSSLGKLSKVTTMHLDGNNLTGAIPIELSGMISMRQFMLANNNLNGEIPDIFGTMPDLLRVYMGNNPDLYGDIKTIFNKDNLIKLSELLVYNTNVTACQKNELTLPSLIAYIYSPTTLSNFSSNDLAILSEDYQDFMTLKNINETTAETNYWVSYRNEIKEILKIGDHVLDVIDIVDELFDGNDVIIETVDQDTINSAQNEVDSLQNGVVKDELQAKIDEAQNQLDEKNATDIVNNLFDDKGIIKDSTNQSAIDEAQKIVNDLRDGKVKDELQDKINEAQKQLDERNATDKVNDLFDDKDIIKNSTDQSAIDEVQKTVDALDDGKVKDNLQDKIDEAQKAVDSLDDGKVKDELQAIIDEAQKQLDAKNNTTPIVKPSTPPTIQKPSVDAVSTTDSSNAVNTADTTNITIFYTLALLSLLIAAVYIKKRKTY